MSRLKKAITLVAFVAAYLLLLVVLHYVWYLFYSKAALSASTEDLVIILATLVIFAAFLINRHWTRESSLAEEAQRWLVVYRVEQKRPSARTNDGKARRRILLWAPCMIVAAAVLFVPEEIGVVSHLFVSRTAALGKYHIEIPITWIIEDKKDDHLSAMTTPGIGRIGFVAYSHLNPPLSAMYFYPVPDLDEQLAPNVYLNGETVLEKRSFALGEETLTCWDLIHNNPFAGPSPKDASMASISCTTQKDDFFAGFYGWRCDSSAFYETIRKITISGR